MELELRQLDEERGGRKVGKEDFLPPPLESNPSPLLLSATMGNEQTRPPSNNEHSTFVSIKEMRIVPDRFSLDEFSAMCIEKYKVTPALAKMVGAKIAREGIIKQYISAMPFEMENGFSKDVFDEIVNTLNP